MQYDVIIIGGGASGIMAMYELTASNFKVCLLEASGTIGGRIASIAHEGFSGGIETGAEFIHGNAPLTMELLTTANLSYTAVTGNMIPIEKGVWFNEPENYRNMEVLYKKLSALQEDCTIRQFLDTFFKAEEYEEIRKYTKQLAEGFCLADIDKASVLSFQKDIEHLDESDYRIEGGYQSLMKFLFEASQDKATVRLRSEVHNIDYRKDEVTVSTKDGKEYSARKVIVTVSAGVLKAGDINFNPGLKEHATAIEQLGFGSVIKSILEFREPFWEYLSKDLGFALSDEAVPTWWTQLPQRTSLLTGWLGGNKARKASLLSEDELCTVALTSLSNIFKLDMSLLKNLLNYHKIICWDNNPYVKGGYSFNTLNSEKAKKKLREPIDNSIYFAGEAIYSGEFQGTVEAALVSGRDVVREMILK